MIHVSGVIPYGLFAVSILCGLFSQFMMVSIRILPYRISKVEK